METRPHRTRIGWWLSHPWKIWLKHTSGTTNKLPISQILTYTDLYPKLFPWSGWFTPFPPLKSLNHHVLLGKSPWNHRFPTWSQPLKRSDLDALPGAAWGASWTRRDRALSSGASMDTAQMGPARMGSVKRNGTGMIFDDVLSSMELEPIEMTRAFACHLLTYWTWLCLFFVVRVLCF